ncbi:DUF2061 domain-containing protein [Isoalcanivorax indicus]|uniref:DUF2061 domain-containing protein n=1 Tax=Isoalcanivorax indicus TaxID=2202653 RepID=UPI000DBA6361|nr:DUF2061 domain-containing protein [Isoalcanivorax indicus]
MIKTASFGVMHVTVAFLVVWAMTGDWMIGGAVALVEPLVNTVAYHFHEKVWLRLRNRSGRDRGASGGGTALAA